MPLLRAVRQGHEKGEYPLRRLYGSYGGGLKVYMQKGQGAGFDLLSSFVFSTSAGLRVSLIFSLNGLIKGGTTCD